MSQSPARVVADVAERAAATYVQAFASALILSGFLDLSAVQAAALAAIPAGLSVVATGLRHLVARLAARPARGGPRYLLDVGYRAAATFAEAFLGALLATGALSLDAAHAALFAAIPAGLAVIKAGAARYVGDADSAALLPASRS